MFNDNNVINSDGLSYWHQVSSVPLWYKTLGNLIDEAAAKFSEREAIVSVEENRRITFKELAEQSDIIAANLLVHGFKKGDRIGISSYNSIDWAVAYLACNKIGIISVLLNPAYEKLEIKTCLNKVNAVGLIITNNFKTKDNQKMVQELFPGIDEKFDFDRTEIPSMKSVYFLGQNQLRGAHEFDSLKKHVNDEFLQKLSDYKLQVFPDDICNIQFTSGTTGSSKAAMLTHMSIVNNAFFTSEWIKSKEPVRLLCSVPFFHVFGSCVTLTVMFHNGTTICIPSKYYNPEMSLRTIVNEKCNKINGTPTMFVDLINQQEKFNFPLEIPKFIVIGGSPSSPDLYNRIKTVLNVKKIYSIYGLTETTASVFCAQPNDTKEQEKNIAGQVLDHLQIRVVDKNDHLVPFGTPGELHVKGFSLTKGYWNDLEKTREIIGNDGWFRTGDECILRKDGYGKIVGRIKDLIIRGGENIYPVEIEDILNSHPSVLESQVIGVPCERLGEEIMACIRLNTGKRLTLNELQKFCEGKLTRCKIPKYLEILTEFPKTHSGKIMKTQLRLQFSKRNSE